MEQKLGKHRSYCFTMNNYSEETEKLYGEAEYWETMKARYVIIGRERGESGTPHLQGYVCFNSPRSMKAIIKLLKGAHVSIARGSGEQNKTYCSKDDDILIETGDIPEQGNRTDLKKITEKILKGELTTDELTEASPDIMHQYGRTLDRVEDLALKKIFRTEMTQCKWYHGPTGVGKSHKVFEDYNPETHFLLKNDKGWWDGFTTKIEVVIINDFRGWIAYDEMLQMIDKWPYKVARRGRAPVPFMAKEVRITSSLSPEEVYNKRDAGDHIAQLLRRVEVIDMDPSPDIFGNC